MSSEKDFGGEKVANDPKSSLDLKSDAKHIEVADNATDVEALAASVNDLPITWFVWVVALTASIAGMLFGYDTGIISGVLVVLKDDLNNRPVTSSEKEMITSLCSGGAFIGAIFAGNTADRVSCFLRGRKSKRHLTNPIRSLVARWPSTSAACSSSLALFSRLPPIRSRRWRWVA